jgi:hypothetical protein
MLQDYNLRLTERHRMAQRQRRSATPSAAPEEQHVAVQRAGWGVEEFAQRYNISPAKIAEEIAEGKLGSVFVAGRRIILIEHEQKWLREGEGKRRITRRTRQKG